MRPLLLILALLPALSACSDTCRLRVTNGVTDPADAGFNAIQVRLEGTSYWAEPDLLDGRLDPDDTRAVRVRESGPFPLDVRGTDALGRTWTRLDAVLCEPPDESLQLTLTDADRDQPCTWTVTNGTGTTIVNLRLRRAGTVAWAREVLEEDLADGAEIGFAMDDDDVVWDLQVTNDAGDLWSRFDLPRCADGADRSLPIDGAPDDLPEAR